MGAFALAPLVHAADGQIQPGLWQSTDKVLEMTNPMMSPEMLAKRKAKPLIAEYWVRSPDLKELILGKDQAGLCKGTASFAGGKISVARKCTVGTTKTTRKIDGTYTATHTDTVREVTMEMPNGSTHSKTQVVSERIGDCP